MSGTYQLDGEQFPENPLRKRWSREVIETSGVGESMYPAFWRLDLELPDMSMADYSFFYDRWTSGGLHDALLPHPRTGQLVGFTGVNIDNLESEIPDVDQDSWAYDVRLALTHISLSATGV